MNSDSVSKRLLVIHSAVHENFICNNNEARGPGVWATADENKQQRLTFIAIIALILSRRSLGA